MMLPKGEEEEVITVSPLVTIGIVGKSHVICSDSTILKR
jgi:hypothetical protein